MKTFILYGVRCSTLDEARHKLEALVDIALDEREGLHAGGVHYTFHSSGKVLDLKNNIDLDDNEPVEVEFPEYPYLLYFNFADKHPALLRKLETASDTFVRLRTAVV